METPKIDMVEAIPIVDESPIDEQLSKECLNDIKHIKHKINNLKN